MDKVEKLITILKNQVRPALGCTEPGAIALAVARAKELLGEQVVKMTVSVDKNVLKNGMGVGIPGTKEHGNGFAAALSVVCGKSEYGLEALKDVNDEAIAQAKQLLDNGQVVMSFNKDASCLEITAQAIGREHSAKVVIYRNHTNIAREEKDGEVLFDHMRDVVCAETVPIEPSLQQQIQNYSIKELITLAKTIPIERLAFIKDGIDMNMHMAEAGLNNDMGVGIGHYMMKKSGNTLKGRAKAYTAAASEARMAGWPLPVMSSAGSGNHGLTAIIPINIYGTELEYSIENIERAVAFSHMITIFVKSYLGALSPICGCGVAAGVGCAAGLTFLREGSEDQIEASILNILAGLTGMICDGAKLGCACKLSVAVDAAADASDLALAGICIPGDNGILAESAEQAIRNMARVSVQGMALADKVIVGIMQEKDE